MAGDARQINPRRGWRPLLFAQFGLSIADVNNESLCRVDGVMAPEIDAGRFFSLASVLQAASRLSRAKIVWGFKHSG